MPANNIGKASWVLGLTATDAMNGLKRFKGDVSNFFGNFGLSSGIPMNKLFGDTKAGFGAGQRVGTSIGAGISSILGMGSTGGALGGILGAGIGAAVGATVGIVETATSSVFGFLEKFKETNKVAREFSIDITSFTQLQGAARLAGVDVEQLEMGLKHFSISLSDMRAGADDSGHAFAMLNLSAQDFKNKNMVQSFLKTAEAIRAIKSPTDQVAAASKVFGERMGFKFLNLLKQNVGDLMKTAHDLNMDISPEEAGRLTQANASIKLMSMGMESLKKEAAVTFAPFIFGAAFAFTQPIKQLGQWLHGTKQITAEQEKQEEINEGLIRQQEKLREGAQALIKATQGADKVFNDRMKGFQLLIPPMRQFTDEMERFLHGSGIHPEDVDWDKLPQFKKPKQGRLPDDVLRGMGAATKDFIKAFGTDQTKLAGGAEAGSREAIETIIRAKVDAQNDLPAMIRRAEKEAADQRAALIRIGEQTNKFLQQRKADGGNFNDL